MSKALGLVAISLVFMLPSMAINAVHQLEHTPGAMAYPLAAAAVLSVLLAGSSPFAMELAVKERRAGLFLMALTAFVVCAAYNLVSAVGAASTARSETSGARQSASLLEHQLASLEKQRNALGGKVEDGNTIGLLDGKIAALKLDVRWSRSKSCDDATLPDSRAFCADLARLQGQRDATVKIEELERQISETRSRLVASGNVGQAADPQASTLAALLKRLGVRASDGAVGKALNLTFALVIEVLGSLGPVVFVALVRLGGMLGRGGGALESEAVRQMSQTGQGTSRDEVPRLSQGGPALSQGESHQQLGYPKTVPAGLPPPSHDASREDPEASQPAPPVSLVDVARTLEALALAGVSQREIARRTGLSKSEVNRRVKAIRERAAPTPS